MVLPVSNGVSRAPSYSRTAPRDRSLLFTGLSPSLVRLSSRLLLAIDFLTRARRFGSETAVVQPRSCNARMLAHERFRLFPVRSPLLGESRLICFPPATEMFQFAGFASNTYGFSVGYLLRGGFPHSEIAGSKLVCQLADAYRRLPRPSSPSTAKASTMCAYSLDHITPRSLGIWS